MVQLIPGLSDGDTITLSLIDPHIGGDTRWANNRPTWACPNGSLEASG